MIANLVSTLLLALGVATGNVSSNVYKGGNAFNHEIEISKEKQIKKALVNQNLYYSEMNSYEDYSTDTGIGRYSYNRKYYLRIDSYNDASASVNTEIGAIRNTVYTSEIYRDGNTSGTTYSYMLGLYKITPYISTYNTDLIFGTNLLLENQYSTNQATWAYQAKLYIINADLDNKYELTTGYKIWDWNTQQTPKWLGIPVDNYTPILTDSNTFTMAVGSNQTINIEKNIGTISEETQLVFTWIATCNYGISERLQTTPIRLNVNGTQTPINYEIVDVPNLMYTILTLPFAWYSTAFNLTIFPGTPYAINFGNIVLTIIAAMILLYIIKKVVK